MRRTLAGTASAAELARVADLVTDLSQIMNATATPADPPPSWLALPADADAAATVLADLVGWLGQVYLRYSDAARGLPECWLWHPDVVEELVWLRHAWFDAYKSGDASVRGGRGLARPAPPRRRPPDRRLHQGLLPRKPPARPGHRRATGADGRRHRPDRHLVGQPPDRARPGPHRPAAAGRRDGRPARPRRCPMTTTNRQGVPMITLNEIEAGDLVQLVDQRGNTASGTVLLDATRGRLCVRAFGVMLPFAAETAAGAWRLAPGVQVVGHTGSLLRAVD